MSLSVLEVSDQSHTAGAARQGLQVQLYIVDGWTVHKFINSSTICTRLLRSGY